jgi:hypothetical protein
MHSLGVTRTAIWHYIDLCIHYFSHRKRELGMAFVGCSFFSSPSAFLENQIHHELADKPLSIIPFVLLQLLCFFYSLSTERPAFIGACMKDRSLPGDKGACALLLLDHCHGIRLEGFGLRSINVV